jgi:hypothetical protein
MDAQQAAMIEKVGSGILQVAESQVRKSIHFKFKRKMQLTNISKTYIAIYVY